MTNPNAYNDEAVIRLGVECIEDMTRDYLSRHSGRDLESYRRFLRHFLAYHSWLRSAVDPDEIIGCMERVRQEKLRNSPEYRRQFTDLEEQTE